MPTFGLIVEGVSDEKALPEIIRKIAGSDVEFIVRPIATTGKFVKMFPAFLQEFEKLSIRIDKALVIRDADNRDPREIEQGLKQRLQEKIQRRKSPFPFPVNIHVIVQELETWLLADEQAISVVTRERASRTVTRIQETLESIQNPRERLTGALGDDIPYTPAVARRIAKEVNIETIKYRCPRFKMFCEQVLNA